MSNGISTQDPDWKAIALALGQRVDFAVQHCNCTGGGLMNFETGAITPWREYMAEAMEMIPGVVIDRAILGTMNLPPSKRKKAQAEIKASRSAKVDFHTDSHVHENATSTP